MHSIKQCFANVTDPRGRDHGVSLDREGREVPRESDKTREDTVVNWRQFADCERCQETVLNPL